LEKYTSCKLCEKEYKEDLKRRQEEHLRKVKEGQKFFWQPCLHDTCPECIGTGIKQDGSLCVHCISCPCPKCSPQSASTSDVTYTLDSGGLWEE
jgi:hypothetical protein